MLLLNLFHYQFKLLYIIITRIIGFIFFEFVYKYGYKLYIKLNQNLYMFILLLQYLLQCINECYICNQNKLLQKLVHHHLKLLYIIMRHIIRFKFIGYAYKYDINVSNLNKTMSFAIYSISI